MGQLPIEQTHHMAPRRKRARLILRSGSSRYFGDFVQRNKIANLAQDGELTSCWFDAFLFHPGLVAQAKRQANTFPSKTAGRL